MFSLNILDQTQVISGENFKSSTVLEILFGLLFVYLDSSDHTNIYYCNHKKCNKLCLRLIIIFIIDKFAEYLPDQSIGVYLKSHKTENNMKSPRDRVS